MRIVIASVQYADFLAVTLPAWRALLPKAHITIVTAPPDRDTQALARAAGVECFVTDAWTRKVPVWNEAPSTVRFNKALALDEAFGIVGHRQAPDVREICLSLDADVVPFGSFPRRVRSDRLYGCARYDCPTADVLEGHRTGAMPREALSLILPRTRGNRWPTLLAHTAHDAERVARQCLGYFQLFRYRPGLRFGSFASAGKYDLVFRDQFATRQTLPEFYVLHLGEQRRENWRGRIVAPWPPLQESA